MAARDPNRVRSDMPVTGDVVRERTHPESGHPQSGATVAGSERVRDTAQQAVETAERTARSALSTQKERAASSLDDIAEVLHAAGEQLRGHDRTSLAEYADRAADRIDEFARTLQRKDVGQLVADAEAYGRRHPEVILGGGLVIGLLAARFLKSSSYRLEHEGEMGYGGARVQTGAPMVAEHMPHESRGTGI